MNVPRRFFFLIKYLAIESKLCLSYSIFFNYKRKLVEIQRKHGEQTNNLLKVILSMLDLIFLSLSRPFFHMGNDGL